jgi:hypothetical protein
MTKVTQVDTQLQKNQQILIWADLYKSQTIAFSKLILPAGFGANLSKGTKSRSPVASTLLNVAMQKEFYIKVLEVSCPRASLQNLKLINLTFPSLKMRRDLAKIIHQ